MGFESIYRLIEAIVNDLYQVFKVKTKLQERVQMP